MDLRRALLLFAIVLAVAAIASSIARPPESDEGSDEPPQASSQGSDAARDGSPSAEPVAAPGTETLRLRAGRKPRVVELEQGVPGTLLVSVETPGEVAIPALGLVQPAEPLTPARFEVLISQPGRHAIFAQPASRAGDVSSFKIGALKVLPTN
jgi:hypothetical protein